VQPCELRKFVLEGWVSLVKLCRVHRVDLFSHWVPDISITVSILKVVVLLISLVSDFGADQVDLAVVEQVFRRRVSPIVECSALSVRVHADHVSAQEVLLRLVLAVAQVHSKLSH